MRPRIDINLPLSKRDILRMKCGDRVFLRGYIYTGRDIVHKRLFDRLKKGKKIPISLKGQIIYYTGPTPAPEGKVIGSCGPTTSSRMDVFTPLLLKKGLKGMIGKGERSRGVVEAIKRYRAVYFVAAGGAGAYLSKCVKEAGVIAYPELGCEAIFCLKIEKFPVIVGIDSRGRNIFERCALIRKNESRPRDKKQA